MKNVFVDCIASGKYNSITRQAHGDIVGAFVLNSKRRRPEVSDDLKHEVDILYSKAFVL